MRSAVLLVYYNTCWSTSNTVPRCTLPQPMVNAQLSACQSSKRNSLGDTHRLAADVSRYAARAQPSLRSPCLPRHGRLFLYLWPPHAGDVNWIFAKSARTLSTRPPVDVEPMLIRRSSPLTSFVTLVCFLSSVLTPRSRRNRNRLISSSDRHIVSQVTKVEERGVRAHR